MNTNAKGTIRAPRRGSVPLTAAIPMKAHGELREIKAAIEQISGKKYSNGVVIGVISETAVANLMAAESRDEAEQMVKHMAERAAVLASFNSKDRWKR